MFTLQRQSPAYFLANTPMMPKSKGINDPYHKAHPIAFFIPRLQAASEKKPAVHVW